ncbi:MAG TPA: hypothetical protein V6D15_20355 [Oculatellaceae cyanobacterium]|jgi:hypothetical protein
MTLRFYLLNFFFLATAQWLFLYLTQASRDVQPLLHGVFLLAVCFYLIYAYLFLSKSASIGLCIAHLSIAGTIFYLVWSVGIVATTHLALRLSGAQGALFYGTSGTQFYRYWGDTLFCLITFLPGFGLNMLANITLRKWLFRKTTNR